MGSHVQLEATVGKLMKLPGAKKILRYIDENYIWINVIGIRPFMLSYVKLTGTKPLLIFTRGHILTHLHSTWLRETAFHCDGGVIYLPSSVWDTSSDQFGCKGNTICTFIIPPSSLPDPETINGPALTSTLLVSSAGSVYTKITVLSVEPFTITEINFWSATITAGDANYATLIPEKSVLPPAFILNLPWE
ncbi:546480f2-2f3c-49dd-96a7-ba9e84a9516e [Sclerotinia trifoliorum]|uniref:546480f2-2f3c-49dd-96a7-ba9e84a9516e n=1 Tax=Sclerotinia trifoliorum TaxID=28548 RepID=A0A8H2VWK4_9HELO|nr:546480f2-2f3c-49dd-96a7-ba9e84a9516e [Sclerotinia trifoliorum]